MLVRVFSEGILHAPPPWIRGHPVPNLTQVLQNLSASASAVSSAVSESRDKLHAGALRQFRKQWSIQISLPHTYAGHSSQEGPTKLCLSAEAEIALVSSLLPIPIRH
jgi:hypothetical protein